jgi:hypothetical protein
MIFCFLYRQQFFNFLSIVNFLMKSSFFWNMLIRREDMLFLILVVCNIIIGIVLNFNNYEFGVEYYWFCIGVSLCSFVCYVSQTR